MSTIKLEDLYQEQNNVLTDLIIGVFHSSIKNGETWRARTLKSALRKGRTKKSAKGQFDLFLEKFNDFDGSTLGDFADYSGYRLIFWVGQNRSKNTRKIKEIIPEIEIRETHFLIPQIFSTQINRDFKIIDLPRLSLVTDPEKLSGILLERYPEKTVFEWLSEKIGRPKDQLISEFPEGISFRSERSFHSKFGLGFQIFSRDQTHFASKRRSDISIHHNTIFKEYLNLEYNGTWPERPKILPTDKFRSHPQNVSDFICPYDYCEYTTCRKNDFDKHVLVCTNETEVVYKQECMTKRNQIRKYLVDNDYIDSDYHNRNFMTYDIESLASKENARVVSQNTTILSEQRIVSVAFATKFASEQKDYLFTRQSFSKEDYRKFFIEIINFLKKIGEVYQNSIPSKISESISTLEGKIAEFREKLKQRDPNDIMIANELSFRLGIPSVKERGLMTKGLRFLKRIQKLRIFGFNSERYDMPIFLPGLLSILKLKVSEVESIKRGTGLMSVDLNLDGQIFSWLDCRNYLAGGSLAQFAQIFGSETTKGIFCYEYFQNIQEAVECEIWPDLEHFKSSLSFPVDNITERLHLAYEYASAHFQMSAQDFLDKMSVSSEAYELSEDPFELPSIDLGKTDLQSQTLDPLEYIKGFEKYTQLFELGIVSNMFDYLGYYNRDDVKILRSALSNYVELFIKELETNPLDFISLPGLAEQIMWCKFSEEVGSPYSFDDPAIAELVRNSRHGGITIILGSRHCEINVPLSERKFSPVVYTTPNGKTIILLISYDFNNLYGHAMRMLMPVGPGIQYIKMGDKFKWVPLMDRFKHKFSYESIEWLNKMEFDLRNPDGSRNVIHHKMNTGEREFTETIIDSETQESRTKTYYPDGYAIINGVEHFFEYDGCHYHQCVHNCSTSRKSRVNKSRDDTARNDFYRKRGILHTITSCVWKRECKNLKFPIHTSAFFHRRKDMEITGPMILLKVKRDKFFGLIRVDLKSPQHVIDKFNKLNFPPIYKHLAIEAEMIHSEYQNLGGSQFKNSEKNVLTQTFHAEQILITTETARFYFDIGIEISNLTWALEFEKDRPFADFVNQITEERKKATRAGNKPLQNIWKLLMNR